MNAQLHAELLAVNFLSIENYFKEYRGAQTDSKPLFLQPQNIVRTFTFDFFGYSSLCPHCINGNDLTLYLNLIQKFRNRCDFVAFLTDCLLKTIFLAPCCHNMCGLFFVSFVSAHGFSVNANDLLYKHGNKNAANTAAAPCQRQPKSPSSRKINITLREQRLKAMPPCGILSARGADSHATHKA